MSNTDLKVDNDAYLVDTHSSTAADNLTGGSKIYLRALSVKYPFENILEAKPKILVDPNRTGATAESVDENWTRRKAPISYQGMSKLIINITGLIDLDSPGSLSPTYQLATVGRLWKLWNSVGSMPFGYFDSRVGSDLLFNDYDPTLGNINTDGSIPVIIKSIDLNWEKTSINKLNYSMILWEDK